MATSLTLHETKPAIYSPGMVIPILGSILSREDLVKGTASVQASNDAIARVVSDEDLQLTWANEPASAPKMFVPAGSPVEFYIERGERVLVS